MTDALKMVETLADALRMARAVIIEDLNNIGYDEQAIKEAFDEEDDLKAIDAAIVQADAFLGVELVVAE